MVVLLDPVPSEQSQVLLTQRFLLDQEVAQVGGAGSAAFLRSGGKALTPAGTLSPTAPAPNFNSSPILAPAPAPVPAPAHLRLGTLPPAPS